MRSPARIDKVLAALRDAWQTSPDLRLGQLMAQAGIDHTTGAALLLARQELAQRCLCCIEANFEAEYIDSDCALCGHSSLRHAEAM
jgi:hypothetical protein